MNEIVFVIEPDEEGGYVAHTRLTHGSIITQGDSLEELKVMIQDAVAGYFADKPAERPLSVRLTFDQLLAVA